MSFSVEFYAETSVYAKRIIEQEILPAPIRTFILHALDGMGGNAVYVKAYGHLYAGSGSYTLSNASIDVRPIVMSIPKSMELKDDRPSVS